MAPGFSLDITGPLFLFLGPGNLPELERTLSGKKEFPDSMEKRSMKRDLFSHSP
jgi:hypothetical protein